MKVMENDADWQFVTIGDQVFVLFIWLMVYVQNVCNHGAAATAPV